MNHCQKPRSDSGAPVLGYGLIFRVIIPIPGRVFAGKLEQDYAAFNRLISFKRMRAVIKGHKFSTVFF